MDFAVISQVLFTIVVMWALCAVLTVTDVFEKGSPARTDNKLELLRKADWFRIPYPCKCNTFLFHPKVFVTLSATKNKKYFC